MKRKTPGAKNSEIRHYLMEITNTKTTHTERQKKKRTAGHNTVSYSSIVFHRCLYSQPYLYMFMQYFL